VINVIGVFHRGKIHNLHYGDRQHILQQCYAKIKTDFSSKNIIGFYFSIARTLYKIAAPTIYKRGGEGVNMIYPVCEYCGSPMRIRAPRKKKLNGAATSHNSRIKRGTKRTHAKRTS